MGVDLWAFSAFSLASPALCSARSSLACTSPASFMSSSNRLTSSPALFRSKTEKSPEAALSMSAAVIRPADGLLLAAVEGLLLAAVEGRLVPPVPVPAHMLLLLVAGRCSEAEVEGRCGGGEAADGDDAASSPTRASPPELPSPPPLFRVWIVI